MNKSQFHIKTSKPWNKPRQGRRYLPGAVSLLSLTLAFTSAMADTGTIASNASDAQVNSASGVLSVSGGTATFNRVGGSSGTQQGVVYAFQIPSSYLTDHSQQFSAATFSTKLGSLGSMSINGDLYGIGYGPTSTVASGDFYEGALDPANTLIQDNFLNPTLTSYATPNTSNATLVAYLNDCLASARADGLTTAYVLLRINPDSYIYGSYYLIGMSEATGGYAPSLSYTTTPIPGWTTVPLGGGGYVTGLVCNGDGSAIYARTDVGGAFRWVPALDGVNGTWASISDAMVPYGTPGAKGLMNVESIGIDPSDLNRVYVGAGGNFSTALRGIFTSPDKGATWTQINTTIRMNGNGGTKGQGERVAVDPNDPNIVWYGSNQEGLYKGVKSGSTWTWTQIPAATLPFGDAGMGITFVVADKNGTSTILYAGVKNASTGGVYKSTDGGTTWAKVSGTSLLTPGRARIAKNGTLYITSGSPTVAKLTRSGTFSLVTSLPTGSSYLGVAVDPNDATDNTVYVAQSNGAGIWYSNNGGASWLAQGTTFNEGPLTSTNHARREPDGTPSLTGYWFGATSSLLITPANSNQLWLGDFFGVSRTSNATAMGTNPGSWWYTLQKNQEETVVLDLKVPPSGPKLMAGVSDVGGFRYNDITVRPTGTGGNVFDNLRSGNNTSLDFSEANTNVWARGWVNSSGSTGSGAVSSDGGLTWLRFGQVGQSIVTNGPTAGWATWDISTFLARQKAKGLNTVTFAIATGNALNGSPTTNLPFDSREATDPSVTPRILVNGTTNLIAIADTMVMGGTPTQNFGNSTNLLCKYYYGDAASSRWIYVKFDLSSVATITTASLQMHRQAAATDTAPFPVGVYYCANNSWVEGDGGTDNLPANEMTWNNKPACVSNAGGGPQEGPNFYDGGTALSGGRIAVSSTNPNVIVWLPINATPRYSTDRGVSWNASTGAPATAISGIYTNGYSLDISGQNLAADRGNGAFYIATYGGVTDNIYRSTDNGATWAVVGTVNNGGSYNGRTPQIVAAPVSPAFPTGGDVWLCDDGTYNGSGGGLWRSTNSGVTWGGISTLGKVTAVTFGKSSSGTGYCVYAAGIKAGVPGIYRSDDYGSTWNLLPNPTIYGVSSLAGDRQTYGKVYLGTPGRGIFIGQ